MEGSGGGKARRGRGQISGLGFVPFQIEAGGADESVQIRRVGQGLGFGIAVSDSAAQVR
jgi:hypothetical protein